MSPHHLLVFGLTSLTALASCASAPAPGDGPGEGLGEPEAAHLAWRAERAERLASPTGYLTLSGLVWLDEGRHTLGAGADATVALPAGRAPELVGTIERTGERVVLEAAPGTTVTANGVPVESVELVADTAGERTLVETGAISFWLIERAGAFGLRIRDPESPVLAAYLEKFGSAGVDAFPFASSWVVSGQFESAGDGLLLMPNVMGSTFEEELAGSITFEHAGETLSLACTGDPSERLFVVFGDATNGSGTYAGGRFLSVGPPDAAGEVTLDFNRAYNPPCAFSPFTTCPLPPEGNTLAFRVTAGERAPGLLH